jgi:hypothetical protein
MILYELVHAAEMPPPQAVRWMFDCVTAELVVPGVLASGIAPKPKTAFGTLSASARARAAERITG